MSLSCKMKSKYVYRKLKSKAHSHISKYSHPRDRRQWVCSKVKNTLRLFTFCPRFLSAKIFNLWAYLFLRHSRHLHNLRDKTSLGDFEPKKAQKWDNYMHCLLLMTLQCNQYGPNRVGLMLRSWLLPHLLKTVLKIAKMHKQHQSISYRFGLV